MINYTSCPICNAGCIREDLIAKDYTVSKKNFDVWACDNCDLKYTDKVPNQSEIGKFYKSSDYISHSDTKVGFINKMYHKVRNHTLNTKRKLVEHFTNTNKGVILDVGCGTGAFLNNMQQAGWQITGLEPDANAIKTANSLYKIAPKSPEELFLLPSNSFDAITMWHVLEHVHDLNGYFKRFFELLNPGGYLIIAVPNPESQDAQTFGAEWAAWDVPRHLYHFTPGTMKRLAEKYHFEWKGTQPMWFDALYVSMLSKEIQQKTKWLGIVDGIHSNIHAMTKNSQTSSLIYVLRKPSS
jgi:2-polyprenyl-3-methyl-5-hydroxy-6-metoxy-1,4-benzoquinol methylase